MKIALLQILPAGSESENLKKGAEWCRRAKAGGADVALFPEMWNCGYRIAEDPALLRKDAISADGAWLRSFSLLAKELEMAIGVTFLEESDRAPKNSLLLFDRFGNAVLHYSKVHTCDFGEEKYLSAGDDFYVCDLDISGGVVRVGAMICYDREFPESARILMLKGAEIILVPNACPMEVNRISQLRARAFENMLGIVTVNYPAGQPDCNGHSTAFDGIVYPPGEQESRDTLIMEAGEEEGVYFADFDLKTLREYRQSEVHGNAYRRPEKYGLLVSDKIDPPFVRADRRK